MGRRDAVVSTCARGGPPTLFNGASGLDDKTLLGTARTLAQRLRPSDLDETLSYTTAAAVELLPNVHASSITVLRAAGR